jgi:hypothetical protein
MEVLPEFGLPSSGGDGLVTSLPFEKLKYAFESYIAYIIFYVILNIVA